MTAPHANAPPETARYRVTGMDCPSCAAKIEGAARKVAGVEEVKVSIASQIMTLQASEPGSVQQVEQAVAGLGYQLARLDRPARAAAASADDDDKLPDLSHVTPAYKRALWIVVLLNVGYGVVEMVGGFVAGSQALKADALDFLGDGLITFLGLLAVGWSLAWRARSALIQGLFLGVLGLGVLVTTGYRVLVLNQPEAELMGIFGAIALVVNVAAAAVLIPHRTGDANVRAVWLFSRNDAIGNLAVVIAAGLVAWTGTPWPDLVVAVVIAALFLQSSWSIIRDARDDLADAKVGTATSARRTGLACMLLAFGLDQATKEVALASVPLLLGGLEVLPFFDLVLIRNPGVSFGLLGLVPWWGLSALGLAIAGILAVWLWQAQSRWLAAGLGLVIGGAFGNVLDRMRHGAVTDFLDFHFAGLHWPAFNLADTGIVIGVALLVVDSWHQPPSDPRPALHKADA